MATAYVYSPRSGSAISLNCYCNRSWTSGTSTCSGTCPGNNCQCTGTSCQSNQNCATCTNPCLCKNCCWHVITQSGYQRPIDISSAADSWIYAYLSAAVASVKRRWSAGLCAGIGGDINQGTVLELYSGLNASGTFIGRVLYGHIKNRQGTDGQVINKSGPLPWIVSIGQIPPVPGGQSCYLSTHVHMEGKSEAGAVSRTPSACNGSVSAGTSVIYSWAY